MLPSRQSSSSDNSSREPLDERAHDWAGMDFGGRGRAGCPVKKAQHRTPDDDGNPVHPSSVRRVARGGGYT